MAFPGYLAPEGTCPSLAPKRLLAGAEGNMPLDSTPPVLPLSRAAKGTAGTWSGQFAGSCCGMPYEYCLTEQAAHPSPCPLSPQKRVRSSSLSSLDFAQISFLAAVR